LIVFQQKTPFLSNWAIFVYNNKRLVAFISD